MASYNRVILLGNLVRDIELRYTTSRMAVCQNAIAVNDRRKNASGEWIDETSFVDVTFFGRTAEVVSGMVRNYAATFGAVTLRLWLAGLTVAGFDFLRAYQIVAWLSWIPNLLVAECWLRFGHLIRDSEPSPET